MQEQNMCIAQEEPSPLFISCGPAALLARQRKEATSNKLSRFISYQEGCQLGAWLSPHLEQEVSGGVDTVQQLAQVGE